MHVGNLFAVDLKTHNVTIVDNTERCFFQGARMMNGELTDESIRHAILNRKWGKTLLQDATSGDFTLYLALYEEPIWLIHYHPTYPAEVIEIGRYNSTPIEVARKIFEWGVNQAPQRGERESVTDIFGSYTRGLETARDQVSQHVQVLAESITRDKRKADLAKVRSQGFVDRDVLEKIDDSTLFYPCSANDLLVPIRLFSPYVTTFWFVDKGYFAPGHYITSDYGLDKPASLHKPVLAKEPDYQFLESKIIGKDVGSRKEVDIDPTLLIEKYTHKPSGKTITIIKRRGYGYSALRNEITSLGVFFYRGDSGGEGGSGSLWLVDKKHVRNVLSKLIDNGLMVLDGSDGARYDRGTSREYASFWKYRDIGMSSPRDEISVCKPFSDRLGNHFRCVGYAGWRYGNTLIWQVKKKEGAE